MRLRSATVASVLAAAALCADAPIDSSLAARKVTDPEAYAVYASLFPEEWVVQVAKAKTLVIQEETATASDLMPSGRPLTENPWRQVVDSFKAANRIVRNLLPGRDVGRPYIVVPSRAILATFREVRDDPMFGWTGFYRRYADSGGYIQLSAVGFDARKERALVYIAHHCGSLCGQATYHFMEKADGAWRKKGIPGVLMTVRNW